MGHIPHSDDAQTSFSSVQLLLLPHLHQNIDNAGFDTARILPDQSCHRYPSTSEEMQFVPWFRMWLFVTKYDFKVLLMQFCQDDSPWRIGGLFCLLGLWSIRKNRKSNPPNQIGHHNKRKPGGLLEFLFCILYSVRPQGMTLGRFYTGLDFG